MNDDIEKLFRDAESVRLDEKKKDAIHRNILSFMKTHPLPAPKRAWYQFSASSIFNYKTANIIVVSLLICGFFGVTIAKADSALPGDLLYPIKVGVNEKIQEVLAFSPEAKLNLNIQLAQLRLQEAEQLAVQNKMTAANEAQISQNFDSHINVVSSYVAELKSKKMYQKADEVSSSLEASLKAHAVILDALQKSKHVNVSPKLLDTVEHIATQLSNDAAPHGKENDNLSANINSLDQERIIQEKATSIQETINKIKKSIRDHSGAIGKDVAAQSEDNLNLAQQKVNESKQSQTAGKNDYQQSISSLHQAAVITQESQDLITDQSKLGVDVPITIPPLSPDANQTTGNSSPTSSANSSSSANSNGSLDIKGLLK